MSLDPIFLRTSRCLVVRDADAGDAMREDRERMHMDSEQARAQAIVPGESTRLHSAGRRRTRER